MSRDLIQRRKTTY